MNYVINGREPADALHYFEDLCAIPHGSGNEKQISDFLYAFFQEKGLEVKQDEMGNISARKAGSKGNENLPALLLQGHMDMVCEKNLDTVHDFEKDGLQLYVDGKYLYAKGTTLGADDGTAVAYMMAIAARNDLTHPPMEFMITVEEETGLGGADAIDPSFFTAKQMINLDESPEGSAFVSCAGGMQVQTGLKAAMTEMNRQAVAIQIRGLLGGHSGNDINAGRANANKLMARTLMTLHKTLGGVNLISVSGGSKPNAIPREADAMVAVSDAVSAIHVVEKLNQQIKTEIGITETTFALTAKQVTAPKQMMIAEDSDKLIRHLYLLPDGLQVYSMVMKDHTDCSLNTGVVTTNNDTVSVISSIRSSCATLKYDVALQIEELCQLVGTDYHKLSEYPGWVMAPTSEIRDLVSRVYQQQTGCEMKIDITHGGLESGILKAKMPDLDIIAIGPTNHEFHTPNEHLDLDSFGRTWELLVAVMKELCA